MTFQTIRHKLQFRARMIIGRLECTLPSGLQEISETRGDATLIQLTISLPSVLSVPSSDTAPVEPHEFTRWTQSCPSTSRAQRQRALTGARRCQAAPLGANPRQHHRTDFSRRSSLHISPKSAQTAHSRLPPLSGAAATNCRRRFVG